MKGPSLQILNNLIEKTYSLMYNRIIYEYTNIKKVTMYNINWVLANNFHKHNVHREMYSMVHVYLCVNPFFILQIKNENPRIEKVSFLKCKTEAFSFFVFDILQNKQKKKTTSKLKYVDVVRFH